MIPRLQVHPDARREFDDAVDYYDRENPGLGVKSTDEVEAGFTRIRTFPDASQLVAPNVRKLVLARFPYTLVYEVRDDFTRILAVAHQRKRPYYWRSRR